MGADKMMNDDEEDMGVQVRVNFVLDPSVEDRSLEVPSEPIAVPSDIRRKGLSAVINHLLDRRVDTRDQDNDNEEEEEEEEEEEQDKLPAIPFDFVLDKKLLRTGVEFAARRQGLSLEQSIPLLYFPAQKAPEETGQSEPTPDWIGCLSVVTMGQDTVVCAASYDGLLRINHNRLHPLASATSHTGPIKCLATQPKPKNQQQQQQDGDEMWVATGSLDQRLVVHSYNSVHKSLSKEFECTEGHTSSIGCLDISSSHQKMVSGDWDGCVCVWDLQSPQDDGQQVATKKLKRPQGETVATRTLVKPSTVYAKAHGSQVSGVFWLPGNEGRVVTGSWDHSVKVLNVDKEETVLSLNGSRVVSCMDLSRHSEVVATGHPDCTVRLWDVREATSGSSGSNSWVSDSSLKPSHKAWISAVRWSPTNPFVLASASHDGTVKMWDIRSSLPLHTIRTQPKDEKNLCLAFGKDGTLYAGGTDCLVKQYTPPK